MGIYTQPGKICLHATYYQTFGHLGLEEIQSDQFYNTLLSLGIRYFVVPGIIVFTGSVHGTFLHACVHSPTHHARGSDVGLQVLKGRAQQTHDTNLLLVTHLSLK